MSKKLVTVWHWGNLGKAYLVVLAAAAAVTAVMLLLQFTVTLAILTGMAAGPLAMIISMSRWDLCHIEWR